MKKKLLIKTKSNLEIATHIAGNGRPVLCLSGFGCSHYNFEFFIPHLSKDFQMIMLDNRGMGESSDLNNSYSLEAIATDALEVMDQLGIERFDVIGISMGGFVAQLLTLMAPERVKTLSLLCTTSGGSDFIPLPKMDKETLIRFQAIAEPRRTEIAIEATVHPSLKKENEKLFNEIVELRRAHPARLEQLLLQKEAVDQFLAEETELSQINCPTLVMTGDADRFVNPFNAVVLREKIKNSELVMIEKTDHLFFLEKASESSRALLRFIKKHDGVEYENCAQK